jgi:AraC-like DNA-binding protein
MGNLAVRSLPPRFELKNCIKAIWMFESNGGLPEEEIQTIVPNGSAKLMLYYEGHFTGRVGDHAFSIPKHRLFVLGVSDRPTIAEFDRNKAFGCLCVEFQPACAYRLLAVPQHELRNALVPLGELIDPSVNRIMETRMYMTSDPVLKAMLLQEYLISLLARTENDAKFEYAVSAIWNSQGRISVAELSQDLGQSARWLHAKFSERLGIGPKTFASIVRFQTCFQTLLRDKHRFLENKQFYDFYYDQAHFIKEFKRFMGRPPSKYAALQNEVGEIIYVHDF